MKNKRLQAVTVLVVCLAALLVALALGVRIAGLMPGSGGTVSQDVTFTSARGTEIHATVTRPGGSGAVPLVVMCHGFTGNRQGDGHFVPLANTLAEQGIASIAIDFAGCGESTEPYTEYTLKSMYDDIDSAIAYMKENGGVTEGKIGLLGHSMGGRAVSMHLDTTIAAAALWSPADNDGLDGLEFLSRDAAERDALRASAAEAGSVELPKWGVTVSSEFIEQMVSSHPWEYLRGYTGALLISFAGGDPDLLSQTTIDGTLQAATDRGLPFTDLSAQFPTANHNYDATLTGQAGDADGQKIAAELEKSTAQFFITALVGSK